MKRNLTPIFAFLLLAAVCVATLYQREMNSQNKSEVSDDSDYPRWIEMMEEPEVNMAEAREAFETYWAGREHFQGDKSKKFERWYTINSNRLDQMGNVISAEQVSSEFQKMRTKSGAVQQGDWYCYGPVNVGPRNGTKRDGGRVRDIEFHPTDPNTYFVSCFKSGLFKTTDAGMSWTPLTDNLIEQVYVSEVDANDANTIYIGTSLGISKSLDGGANWTSTPRVAETKDLLLKSDNQNVILAGCKDGIYRSEDGGASWNLVQAADRVEDLESHPTNANILYASTNDSPSNFYRSEDGGQTWSENTSFGQGTFMKVATTPAEPDYVYLINSRDHLGDDSFEGVYRSTDAGLTFTKQSDSPCITGYKADGAISRGQPNYNLFILADPVNASVLYAGGVKSWKSTDGGLTWTHYYENITTEGDNLHMDQLEWGYNPHTNVVFAVNDGGVYYLTDQDKFQMITDGLPIAEVYECTQSQTKKTNVAGGTMHCGVKLNKDGIWYSPWGGDEATCIIDYSDENYVYHIKYDKVQRSSNGGFNYTRINSGNTDRGNYVGTGTLHKGDSKILFVGMLEVTRTKDARASSVAWETISSFGGTTKIQKVEQSTANHNVLYVARGSKFYRCDDANAASPSFLDLSSTMPISGSVNDIASHPTNENLVYILLGSKIYKSSDKGSTWTDITLDLPSVALMEMVYDKTTDEGIYVGTDLGVFYKDAAMTSWVDYSKNLPVIKVSGMDIYYGSTKEESLLTVSTDGRGFWRSPVYGVTRQAPVCEFTSDKTTILPEGSIKFTDSSINYPTSHKWTFEGGTPASSINENPKVSYDTPGSYAVSLSVANSAGSDVITKTGYITVSDGDGGTLQVHYSLDGNTNDASLYGRNATNSGVTFIDDATMSTVADFDGSDHLTVPDYKGVLTTESRTITAWIKTDTPNKAIVAWGKAATSTKWVFRLETTGVLRLEPGGGNIIGSSVVTDNQWHHVACTFEDDGTPNVSDVKLYVDGVLEATTPAGVAINTTAASDVTIGNDQMARKFVGQMSDVRIYSEALSLQQVQDIMNEVEIPLVDTPVADFSASPTNITEGETVQFTDLSTYSPTSWEWTFEGGSPSASTEQNPLVTYNAPGIYPVTLKASNSGGSNSLTKTDYITVIIDGGPLQAHYLLEGNVVDASLYQRDANNEGVTFADDADKQIVASFNGEAQLTIPGYAGVLASNPRTVSAWIKTSTANNAIVAWGEAATSAKWAFRMETTGVLRLEPGGGSIIGSTVLTDDQWHHVACVFEDDGTPDVSDVKLYVDGELEATTPSSLVINTTVGNDVKIGNDHMGRNFIGKMSDVRIYSEALTPDEIKDLATVDNLPTTVFDPFNGLMKADLSLYPNPVSDILNIQLVKSDEFEMLFVRNIQGKLLLNRKVDGECIQLNISHLVSGVYFIEAKGKSKKKAVKFIKK